MDYQEAIKVLHYATLSGGHPKDLCDMKAVATLAMQELQEYKCHSANYLEAFLSVYLETNSGSNSVMGILNYCCPAK